MTSPMPTKRPKPPPVPTHAILAKTFHWINLMSLIVMSAAWVANL